MRPCEWRCSCDASRKIFHLPSNHSFLLIWCSCTSLLWSETYVPYVWPFLLHGFSCLSGESVLSLVTDRDIHHRRTRTSDSRYFYYRSTYHLSSRHSTYPAISGGFNCLSQVLSYLSLFFFQPQASALMASRISTWHRLSASAQFGTHDIWIGIPAEITSGNVCSVLVHEGWRFDTFTLPSSSPCLVVLNYLCRLVAKRLLGILISPQHEPIEGKQRGDVVLGWESPFSSAVFVIMTFEGDHSGDGSTKD